PYEQFLKSLSISFVGGFIFAFPYFIWEIWRFIKPGLHPKERKGLRGNVFIMSMLFFLGVSFAYYVILPFAVQFLSNYSLYEGVSNDWRIGNVISMVTQIVIAGGILFEMPILVYYLSKMGILTPQFMKKYRRHATVVLLVLSAIITPPDVVSQILIFFPLSILYEISIRICKRVYKRAAKEAAKEKAASNGLQTTS
ncbi:MAG: twin-arginine translocase subunit TatC, partial [Bacteroidota bacterium]